MTAGADLKPVHLFEASTDYVRRLAEEVWFDRRDAKEGFKRIQRIRPSKATPLGVVCAAPISLKVLGPRRLEIALHPRDFSAMAEDLELHRRGLVGYCERHQCIWVFDIPCLTLGESRVPRTVVAARSHARLGRCPHAAVDASVDSARDSDELLKGRRAA